MLENRLVQWVLKRLPTLELACAVIVGAIALARRGELHPWTRLTALWWDFRRPKVSAALFNYRMSVCRSCPIFYAPLQTCGSPLKRYEGIPKEITRIGCWCHMPTKAFREASCWRYETVCSDREARVSAAGLEFPSFPPIEGGWNAGGNSYQWPKEIEGNNDET